MRAKLFINVILAGASMYFLSGAASAQAPPQQRPTMGQTPPTGQPSADRVNPNITTDTMRTQTKTDDNTFARNAASGGMMEVELGKIAAEKGGTEGVKQFGQKMVDDHTKANDELKQVAGQESITLPTSLSRQDQAQLNKLSKLSGAAFDKAYVNDMVKDHEKDVAEFQEEANSGSNATIKNFAAKTLPTLQDHLRMAKELQKNKNSAMR